MASTTGKQKGGDFERVCCRRFSRWVSGGTRDDLFWRSATSGGRATFLLRTQGTKSPAQAGDMTAIDPAGYPLAAQCLLEFKFYADLQVEQALIKRLGWLWEFWERTVKDAATYGKQPVLVAKQNRYPPIAIVPAGFRLFRSAPVLLTSATMQADFYDFEEATEVSS